MGNFTRARLKFCITNAATASSCNLGPPKAMQDPILGRIDLGQTHVVQEHRDLFDSDFSQCRASVSREHISQRNVTRCDGCFQTTQVACLRQQVASRTQRNADSPSRTVTGTLFIRRHADMNVTSATSIILSHTSALVKLRASGKA